MIYRNEDWAYAHTRLAGTYVLYKSAQLVRIDSVRRNGVRINSLDGESLPLCQLKDLNVQDFRLGFVNFPDGADYVSRKPMRRDWRQGLRPNNLLCRQELRDRKMQYVSQTLLNNFPTLEECVQSAKEDGLAKAWHRHWCLGHDMKIYYRDLSTSVGSLVKGEPKLSTRFQYLAEALEESL